MFNPYATDGSRGGRSSHEERGLKSPFGASTPSPAMSLLA